MDRASRCELMPRAIRRALVLVLLGGVPLLSGLVAAIDPADGLRQGQDLVEQATREIDARISQIRGEPLAAERLYEGIQGLFRWAEEFTAAQVAARYRVDSAEGLLIRDGIADTLATRLEALLGAYVAQYPDEPLDRGREALEIALSRMELPPGRILGFHVLQMGTLYGAQADTILTIPALATPGVKDGFLRHVWDLTQVYAQVHGDPAQKYFCRLAQEDWLATRIVCGQCRHRGVTYKNQMTGVKEDTTAVCRAAMDVTRTDPGVVLERIACRHWGHIFSCECPECGAAFEFAVPLPYYRLMQRDMASGAMPEVMLPEDRVIRMGE